MEKAFEEIAKENNLKVAKSLGRGGFGLVKEVTYNKKSYAAKLIKKSKEDDIDESDLIMEFRGPGIVKIIKIFKKIIGGETYHLILMEKAALKSLSQFNYYMHKKNLLNLIFKSPFEIAGDNLLRFYVR